jgi:hypothetical protein
MALDVTASVEIDATPAAVAAIQFDPTRDPEWIGGVDRVELVTAPPLGTGSKVRRLGGFLGRPIVWLMDVDYRLEPLDGGRRTRASIRIRGEGRGMYGLPGPLMGPMVKRSVAADLKRLKAIVERSAR